MSTWRAIMPRTKAKPGHVHLLISTKSDAGRGEMTGEISAVKARLLWKLANMKDEEIIESIKGSSFGID